MRGGTSQGFVQRIVQGRTEAAADSLLTEKKSERISYTYSVSLGGCLLESLDDITRVLAAAQGEGFK